MTSTYGVLRITPISADTVRINFSKDSLEQSPTKLPSIPEEIVVDSSLKWNCRELRDKVEITTGRLIVRVDKKSGAISFYTVNEKLLLAESTQLPRQLGCEPKNQTWTYFNWGKKELLKARGASDTEWLELPFTARYISHGNKSQQPACLMSNDGYQLLVPAGVKTLCCTIPMYGPYLYTEGVKQIDYFFRTAR